MNDRPVILLNFANQQDAYLQHLKEESTIINDLLSPHHDKQAIEIYREENATLETATKAITRFRERIVIFHYGGHADGERLHFEGGGAHAEGLAELIGSLPNIQLVFLNGCATMPQVKKLLAQGVPAVIATAVPIDDKKAVHFAEFFYGALAQQHTIGDAYKLAVRYLRAKYGGDFGATIVKKDEIAAFWDTVNMPWGLFVNNNADKILNWTIPTNFVTRVTRPPEVQYEVNRFMVDILDAMIDYDPALENMAYDENGNRIDPRESLLLVIEQFPWPISVQIRLLAIKDNDMDKASVERIKQMVSTYMVTAQFLLYVITSQLWEDKRNMGFDVMPHLHGVTRLEEDRFLYFDFFHNFIETLRLLQKEDSSIYIKEFQEMDIVAEFDRVDSELHKAYLYLESLRSLVNQERWDELEQNKHQYCADGEYFLSSLLIYFAFLVRYDLLTIRNIHVINPKYLGTKFNHYIGRLNAKVTDIAVSRTPKPKAFDSYAHNSSVILTSDAQHLQSFLNLSPFLIDKNAFGDGITGDHATEQLLYMFAYRNEDNYKYFTTTHNIYRAAERLDDHLSTSELEDGGRNAPSGRRRPIRRSIRRPSTRTARPKVSPYKVLEQQFQLLEDNLIN